MNRVCANLLAAVTLGLASVRAALAYEASDVCRVDVSLAYTLDAEGNAVSNTFMFSIDDQDTSGQIDLAAGTFTIKVEGKLCTDLAQNAYVGQSTPIAMVPGGDPQTIAIVALDQEAAANQNVDVNARPIITSLVVSPSVVRAGQIPSISFAAVDPNGSGDLFSWTLTATSAGSNWQGGAPVVSAGCTATDAACAYDYTAHADDAGQMPFSMVVADVAGLEDSVTGVLAVDTTGRVIFDVANYNRPTISGFAVVTAGAAQDSEVANIRVPYAAQAAAIASEGPGCADCGVMTFDITDTDLVQHPGHSVTIAVVITELLAVIDPTAAGQAAVGCDSGDFTITTPTFTYGDAGVDATGKVAAEIRWNPWANAANAGKAASDFGESWCQFAIAVTDNSPASTLDPGALVSDTYTYTMGAIGTEQDRSTSAVPQFAMIFVEDYAPVVGDEVTVIVTFDDLDASDLTQLRVDATALDTGYGTAGVTEVDYACDGGANCNAISIVLPAITAAAGSHNLVLTITDTFNTDLKDVRTIAFQLSLIHI